MPEGLDFIGYYFYRLVFIINIKLFDFIKLIVVMLKIHATITRYRVSFSTNE